MSELRDIKSTNTGAYTNANTRNEYQVELMKFQQGIQEPLIMARQNTEDSGRTEVDVGTVKGSTSQENIWPEDCVFFDPYTMDANHLRFLLWQESAYVGDEETVQVQRQVSCVSLENAEHSLAMCNPSSEELSQWLSDTTFTTRVVYIGAKRSALDLLHDNNGGFSSHITSSAVANDNLVSTFHISIKLGDTWPRDEHFIVARHDFLDHRNTVLIAGTDSRALCETLSDRLSATERSDIFCVLVVTLSLWLNQTEKNRWTLDYEVQEIQRKTTSNAVQYVHSEPPTLQQLCLTEDMTQTDWSIGLLIASMENMIKSIDFAKEQHLRYNAICCRQMPSYKPPCPVSSLQDALSQYRSQACSKILQMQMMQARVAAQIAVTNTLIAHRGSRATIDLAKAMKADSKLMKRLSLVTVIFLPATFLATFFSMTFFHIGGSDEHPALEVSVWIWLYFLGTVPLTLFLVLQYGIDARLRELLQRVLVQSRPYLSGGAGDSEAQIHQKHQDDEADGGRDVTESLENLEPK